MTARWYVVQAAERSLPAMQELATEIQSLGFETLVAVEYRRVRGPKRTHVWRPFPAYGPFLFARFDPDAHSWPGILELPGASAVMVYAGSSRPAPVPEATMREVVAVQWQQAEKARTPEQRERRRRLEWKPLGEALREFSFTNA